MSRALPENVVIIGGGLAGARAAETLREHGFGGSVRIVAAEDELPYERPPLSKGVLLGKDEPATAYVHDEDWYAANDVLLHRGVAATAIERAGHRVTLADGTELPYDALLLATGSRPRTLDLPGAGLDGVVTLRTMSDSTGLLARLRGRPRVVVVGAGWIGLEVAAAAREHGCEVTVLEPAPSPLHAVLGPGMGGVFRRLHEEHGVVLRFEDGVAELLGSARVEGVRTRSGLEVPADLVVVGVGAVPNSELADAAGLEVDDGVRVDSVMRSSDPDIYAAGDVARWDNPTLGYPVRVEHWATALNTGPIAARAILGEHVDNDVLPYFFSDQYDLGLEYVGHVPHENQADVVVRGDFEGREFVAFWLQSERVLAALAVNVWDTVEPVKALIRSRVHLARARLADAGVPLEDLARDATGA